MNQDVAQWFERGNSLLRKGNYDEAFNYFKRVVEQGNNDYMSGSYVNMAKCLIEGEILNKEEDQNKEIESFLEEALKIKPNNQAAFANYFWYHLSNKRFADAIGYFLKINIQQFIDQGIFFLEKIHDFKSEEEADVFYMLYKKYPQYSRILINVAMWHLKNSSPHKAYEYLKESLKQTDNDINILSGLSLVCNVLNNPVEAEEYCRLGIKALKPYKKDENAKNALEGFRSNLALSLMGQHRYEEVVELLSTKVKKYPNNTDFHNLAHSYYMLGNINEAYINCQKALYISEDETSFFLMGECLFAKKEYQESVHWYKKALSFMEESEGTFSFSDERMKFVSISIDSRQTLKTIYLNLIHAFLVTGDYLSARAYYDIACTKFPYDHDVRKLLFTINSLESKTYKIEEINSKVQAINNELTEQKRLLQERTQSVKEWALELIKLQNRCVDDDVLLIKSEDDWKVIEDQMLEIANAMKSARNYGIDYQQIVEDFKAKYAKLSKKSLDFLSTGEYLYRAHLNDNTIDFAPIMVEFCKVVENELNVILKQKMNPKKNDKNYSLGQLRYKIERIKPLNNFVPILVDIIGYRNGSAHTGSTTSEKTGKVRKLLIEDGWLNFILSQK